MNKVYLALTNSGYWGRGKTIEEAMNNAHIAFKDEAHLEMFVKEDGSDFTDKEYEEVYAAGMSMFYPSGSKRITVGNISLRNLACVKDTEKIGEEFMNVMNERGIEYVDVERIEKILAKYQIAI